MCAAYLHRSELLSISSRIFIGMKQIIRENLNSKLQELIEKYLTKTFSVNVMDCYDDLGDAVDKGEVTMTIFLESNDLSDDIEDYDEDDADYSGRILPRLVYNDDYITIAKKFPDMISFITRAVIENLGLTSDDIKLVKATVIQFVAAGIKEEFLGDKGMKPWFIQNFVK
jgi:hypothetical protein